MGRWVRIVGAVTAVIATASCTQLVEGHGEMAHPALGAGVQWHPCGSGGQCGALAVPIDYDNPTRGVATIALIRFPATGAKTGSVLFNPGGPGGSGVDFVAGVVKDLPE